ncbi:MAG: hypothetical protein AAF790_03065 [Planctomycetota bacterium]
MSAGEPQQNPFQSPLSVGGPAAGEGYAGGPDSPGALPLGRTIEMLRATRPWVSVIAFCMAFFTVLLALFSLALVVAPQFAPTDGDAPALVLAAAYLVLTLLYVFPTVFLFRYAGRIKAFVGSGSIHDLDDALQAQKSFWKFIGICVLLYIGLMAVGLLMALVFGALAAL